jgi:putative PIG3 family NAD(P)H quinone oxidoreductase
VHAVLVEQPGGPEQLVLREVPDPVPAAGEVLVDVAAAGVNRADVLQRQGRYPSPPGAPDWPGLEVSGVVAALGAGTAGWSVGDEVCALLAGGGYATRVVVPAGQLLPRPEGVDLVAAAALPEAVCTVWSNVVQIGRLAAGEVLLVHGGASGVGTAAIQIGRALGARVAVTAGSGARLTRCAELGAEILVDYHREDFVGKVRDATGGHGADVILDVVGGGYLTRNLDVLATGGRLVVIAVQGGARAELDLAWLMLKRATIAATTLRSRPPAEKAALVAAVREHAWPLVATGALRPVVDRVLPLARAGEAHRVMEAGEHVGKILLTT